MGNSILSESCPQCGAPVREAGQRVTCRYCGASLLRTQSEDQAGWGVHLRAVVCTDAMMEGLEVFRMLIPAEWAFEGGAHWRMDHPGAPALLAFRCVNPNGLEAFEVFPNIHCYWTNQPMVLAMHPAGSVYFGNEVRPPVPALQGLRELVVPRQRAQFAPLEWLKEEHLPELPDLVRAGSPIAPDANTTADGGRVRIGYLLEGEGVEEDIFGVVEVTRILLPGLFPVEHLYWALDYLFACRARQGRLDGLADQFLAIVRSFRLNPAWFARVMQVSQYLIQNQIQHIRQIGQLSQIISRTSSEISDMMMSSYEQRQQTMDNLSTQFSQAIRGVDEYHDTHAGQGVELPGGYGQAWSNNLGEYILSDNPNFNPNLGSNLHWERMEKK